MVSGKAVTGFTHTEEEGVGLNDAVPFLIEDMLKENGCAYHKGDDWVSFVVIDAKAGDRSESGLVRRRHASC